MRRRKADTDALRLVWLWCDVFRLPRLELSRATAEVFDCAFSSVLLEMAEELARETKDDLRDTATNEFSLC